MHTVQDLIQIADWRAFQASLGHDSQKTLQLYERIQASLIDIGVGQELVEKIHQGFLQQQWEPAVAAFGAEFGKDTCFYAGPMTPSERIPYAPGSILLSKNTVGFSIAELVNKHLDQIGSCLFGFPCSFEGRKVELYNVLDTAGVMNQKKAPIALFTPFYLQGWVSSNLTNHVRRTILFHNVVKERFRRETAKLATKKFVLQGTLFQLSVYNDQQIDEAVSLWLTLHELMHSSGPLPLFNASVKKLGLGAEYGCFEEARVDMSAWLALYHNRNLFGPTAELACIIILCERLFRSSQRGLFKDTGKIGVEGEHALLWINAAIKKGVAQITVDNKISLDIDSTAHLLTDLLTEIYTAESFAADTENGQTILKDMAGKMREEYLSPADDTFKIVQGWIEHLLSERTHELSQK